MCVFFFKLCLNLVLQLKESVKFFFWIYALVINDSVMF